MEHSACEVISAVLYTQYTVSASRIRTGLCLFKKEQRGLAVNTLDTILAILLLAMHLFVNKENTHKIPSKATCCEFGHSQCS